MPLNIIRIRRRTGFTLVETMVAGGLLVSISLMAVLWLTGLSDLWWTSTTQSNVRMVSQMAVNRMVSELRSGTRTTGAASPPWAAIPAAPNNTSVTFYLPADVDGDGLIINATGDTEWNAAPVQYVYVPAQRQLLRIQGASQIVLANDVTAATFQDRTMDATLSSNEIRVSLTLQRTTPQQRPVAATSVEIVKLRN